VQHHHAHLASCLADNEVTAPALGLIWDGTGLGTDGVIWGGEALLGDCADYRRVASLRPFRLPGGDAAIRQPRRTAFALLHGTREGLLDAELPPVAATPARERIVIERMLDSGVRAPWTTSMGRLFDGVASLLGLRHEAEYEAQGAIALEHAVDATAHGAYPLPLDTSEPIARLDWRPLVDALLVDMAVHRSVGVCAARFHRALAHAAVGIATAAGCGTVALSGGCFQNRVLAAWVRDALETAGFRVLLHRHVPANDGGIALGQLAVALARGA
jgi:hydrogenase maturation protein HypF